MSDIRKGDLVMVVRDCCGHWLGRTFRVECVSGIPGGYAFIECDVCKAELTEQNVATNGDWVLGAIKWCPVSWLKRLPGLEELDRNEIVEELTA